MAAHIYVIKCAEVPQPLHYLVAPSAERELKLAVTER